MSPNGCAVNLSDEITHIHAFWGFVLMRFHLCPHITGVPVYHTVPKISWGLLSFEILQIWIEAIIAWQEHDCAQKPLIILSSNYFLCSSAADGKSVPIIAFTEKAEQLQTDAHFKALLVKLGLHTSQDTRRPNPSIPAFWTSDMSYMAATKLGDIADGVYTHSLTDRQSEVKI